MGGPFHVPATLITSNCNQSLVYGYKNAGTGVAILRHAKQWNSTLAFPGCPEATQQVLPPTMLG